ncbi:MAG TPA: cytochrome c [Desulfuromonadales bacterium]|nr:cytochrome c [Desulfuromonadales bacterium]
MKRFLMSLIILLFLMLGGGMLFIYSGVYNIAASEPHYPLTRRLVEITVANSVKHHAAKVAVPSEFESADRRDGFRLYREMCLICHGAPGTEHSELAEGLRPEPPELHEDTDDFSPEQTYWIIAHGLKMTGMPAFGESHSEEELWTVTAFVRDLPELSAEQWRALDRSVPRQGKEAEGHDHESHAH